MSHHGLKISQNFPGNNFAGRIIEKYLSKKAKDHFPSYLGNGDSLLFHNFMDCSSIRIHHLVKFINTTNSLVCQH